MFKFQSNKKNKKNMLQIFEQAYILNIVRK